MSVRDPVESTMSLTQQDIDFIKTNMAVWLAEQSLGKPPAVYEIELRERMVRVEEELKHQRELMRQGFEQMDKRFEAMQANMDRRFEQIDKRFEQVEKRFEQIDKRFDEMIRRHDRHFMWLIGFITMVGGLVVAAGKLW
jgi:DNA anti-recombination protein RmuC